MARDWSSVSAKGKRAQNSSQVPSGGRHGLGVAHFSQRGDADQFTRHVADALLHLGFAGLPAGAAQLVQRRALMLAAVARQDFDVLDRQEQLLVAVVDQAQAVVRRAGDVQRGEAVVAADAVFLVHDEVALGDFGGLGDELVGALAAARRAGDAFAQQVLLADQGDAIGDEAAFNAEHDQGDGAGGLPANRGIVVFRDGVLEAVLAQQVGQSFARAAGPGGDDDAAAFGGPAFGLAAKLVEDVDAGPGGGQSATRLGEDRARTAAAIDAAGAIGFGEGGEGQQRAERQHLIPVVAAEIQHRRRNRPIRRLAVARDRFAGLGVVGDHLQPRFQHLVGLVIQADRGVGQIVEQVFHRRMEQRHPVLHARVAAARRRSTDRSGPWPRPGRTGRASRCGSGRSNSLPSGTSETGRRDRRFPLAGAALGRLGSKTRINSMVSPNRSRRTGSGSPDGKDVDDAAAHGVFAGLHHRAGAAVAVGLEEFGQLFRLHLAVDGQVHAGAGEGGARRDALHQGVDGGQDDARAGGLFQQPRQSGDALGDQGGVRRHAVVGQAVPGGEAQDLGFRHDEGQRLGQPGHAGVVAGDVQDMPACSRRRWASRKASQPSGAPQTLIRA